MLYLLLSAADAMKSGEEVNSAPRFPSLNPFDYTNSFACQGVGELAILF
jgi:hypothetical protein